MKGIRIYRTRRNRYGVFDSMTVDHDTKQVSVIYGDSFINSVTVVSVANFQSMIRQFRKDGYEITEQEPWERQR